MDSRIWDKSSFFSTYSLLSSWFRKWWVGLLLTPAIAAGGALTGHLVNEENAIQPIVFAFAFPIGFWTLAYVLVWTVWAPRIQLNSAKNHISYLERKPTVRIGDIKEEVIQNATEKKWYIPVTNEGPGIVKVNGRVTELMWEDEDGPQSRLNPIASVRWNGGSGDFPSLGIEYKTLQEHETDYLAIAETTGVYLSLKEGRLLASNSANNQQFHAEPSSSLRMTIQVFGDPSLANETRKDIEIPVPDIPERTIQESS